MWPRKGASNLPRLVGAGVYQGGKGSTELPPPGGGGGDASDGNQSQEGWAGPKPEEPLLGAQSICSGRGSLRQQGLPGERRAEAHRSQTCVLAAATAAWPGPWGRVVPAQPSPVSANQPSPGLGRLGEDLAGLRSEERDTPG